MRNRSALTLLVVALSVTCVPRAASAASAPVDRALIAPLDALVVAMNRGDDRAIAAVMTADVVIMDEVAPYRWMPPAAEQHWSHDDGALIRKRGVTNSHSVRADPTFVHHDATHAFMSVPLTYDYTLAGKRQHETGLWTIVMVKTGAIWRIALLGFAKLSDTSDATWNGS